MTKITFSVTIESDMPKYEIKQELNNVLIGMKRKLDLNQVYAWEQEN